MGLTALDWPYEPRTPLPPGGALDRLGRVGTAWDRFDNFGLPIPDLTLAAVAGQAKTQRHKGMAGLCHTRV
jgi:hypothetical protein